MQSTGTAIREAREKADLSQRDLARLVLCGQPHICNLEKDRRIPSGRMKQRLVRVLDVSPLDLEATRIQRVMNAYYRQEKG
jgi:transcriptional regulator with XRE-family HTH domain